MQESTQPPESKPVPDPTERTREDLLREIASVRGFVLGEIRHAGELSQERFRAIDSKFDEVARRTAEQKTDTKDALDAALQAAKDAVSLQTEASDKSIAKSEAATTKQIDALGIQVDRSNQAKDEKIEDLKERLAALETRLSEITSIKAGESNKQSGLISIAALGVSALFLIVAAIGLIYTFSQSSGKG